MAEDDDATTERTTPGEPLLSTVYASVANEPFSEVSLALLLTISRANNEAVGITGTLIYRDQQFMQALEGPASAVRTALATISADPRHHDVWVLLEEPITERRYPQWSMRYQTLSDADVSAAPAWFGSPDSDTQRAASRADELVAWFTSR
jgi:hypothetical protein